MSDVSESAVKALRSFSLPEREFGIACAILYGNLKKAASAAGVPEEQIRDWVAEASADQIISMRDRVQQALESRMTMMIDYLIPAIVRRVDADRDPWPFVRSYCALYDRLPKNEKMNKSSNSSGNAEVVIRIPGVTSPSKPLPFESKTGAEEPVVDDREENNPEEDDDASWDAA